jgi:cupin 2 domain-containing protein
MPLSVAGNLWRATPCSADREQIHPVFATDSLRIEHIVSHGQPSPVGFWYDQPDPEWVVLLKGTATISFAGEESIDLCAGDYLLIPAHLRHRVEQVSEDAIWLAVHFRQGKT